MTWKGSPALPAPALSGGDDPAALYGPDYYATHCGNIPYSRESPEWRAFFGRVADEIVRSLAPRRVFDAGCAIGLLVETLWDRGVETHGRDISTFAISQVRPDMRRYCTVGSIAAPIRAGYDLVICMEVLEHLPEPEALAAIAAMAQAAPRILMSSSPMDFDEPTHINVRPTIYWLRAFADVGFAPVPSYDASFVCPHAVLLERSKTGREHADLLACAEMVRLRLEAADLRKQAEDLRQQVDDLRKQAALMQEAAEAARVREAEAERRARDEAERQIAQVRLEAAVEFKAVREEAERQVTFVEREAALARRHRDAILNSTSWQVTRPMRALVRIARREPSAIARMRAVLHLPARTPSGTPAPRDVVHLCTPPAPRTVPVDIVVCVHNAMDDVRRCFESILACTLPPYRLIVVDDGSSPEAAEELQQAARAHAMTLIRHDAAKGYTAAANAGLRASMAPWVVLLNSDTVVTDGWLDRMAELGQRDPRIGLIGPLSNAASWQSVPRIPAGEDWAESRLPDGVDVAEMGRLVARASARQGIDLPFLNGFCLMLRRKMLDDVGLLDEATFGAGYGEENDLCIRARARGWRLLVAEDTYVHHAQSRSYSHARRIALVQRSDEALARKHDAATQIAPQLRQCQEGLAMTGVRARVGAAIERARLIEAGRARWEGRRIAFVLPVAAAGGGANVVMQEARAMRRIGVDVWLVNVLEFRRGFETDYPALDIPCVWAPGMDAVAETLATHWPRFDAIVATSWNSLFQLPPADGVMRLGYYVQDVEPLFYEAGSSDQGRALESYTRRPDVRLLTKTQWNAEQIAATGAPTPAVVGPSVDIDLFRPLPRPREGKAHTVQVCAMLRPSTPRRAAGLTAEVMQALRKQFGGRVALKAFGDTAEAYAAARLPMDGIENLGMLRPAQTASLLAGSDIFLDFSTWQALGLTALEAMACGCAVTVPRRGGATSFARDNETALVCDTSDADSCRAAAVQLVEDESLRGDLQRAAIQEAARHPPELAALGVLDAVLGDAAEA